MNVSPLDGIFNHLRPPAKVKMLKAMPAPVKASWDSFQAQHQADFAAAHPPVMPLEKQTEIGLRAQILKKFPDAEVKLDQYAPIDCDGSGPAYGDVETDFQTSLTWNNQPLNADQVLYHVATVDRPDLYDALAVNFYGGRMVPTVFGDEGPRYGEASHLAIQLLGLYSSPIDGGEPSGHDMYLLHGLGSEFWATGKAPTPDNLNAFCKEKGIPGF